MKDLTYKMIVERKSKTFKVSILFNYRGNESKASYEGKTFDEISEKWKLAKDDNFVKWIEENYGKKNAKKIFKSFMKDCESM